MGLDDFDFQRLEGHRDTLLGLQKSGKREPFPSLVFNGPPKVGKRLAAVWYAAYLNCHADAPQSPCGRCRSCLKVLNGSHPDISFTKVPDSKTVVGVSEVREAVHELHHAPFEGNFRVWIIEEGERLTDEAQNALLKTLEEPPSRAVILLVTNLAGALLPTVSSRCRLVRFHSLSAREVVESLRRRDVEPKLAESLTRLCEGALGSALSLSKDPHSLQERAGVVEMFSRLPGGGLWQAVETAQKLETSKLAGTEALLDLGISFYRDLLVFSVGSSELVTHREMLPQLEDLASRLSSAAIKRVIREFQEADEFLRRNVSPRLLLQRLCINIAKAE